MKTHDPWPPTKFLRYHGSMGTSMETVHILTNSGNAYLKALGNREGPHHLAMELVGTTLAGWFELPIFQYALMAIDEASDQIEFRSGGMAATGRGFVTKELAGHPWGGAAEELKPVVNLDIIGRLVVFDTWIRNYDRHPPTSYKRKPNPDNVFIADRERDCGPRLVVMDHTHCMERSGLNRNLARIDRVKDPELYGVFPAFRSHVRQVVVEDAIKKLGDVDRVQVDSLVAEIPSEWDVDKAVRTAMVDFLVNRAAFVAATVAETIASECWRGRLFDSGK